MLARAGLELIPLTELAKATKAARKAAARHRGIAAQATHKRRRENAQAALVGEPERSGACAGPGPGGRPGRAEAEEAPRRVRPRRGERLQQEPPREPPGAAAASADGADDAALCAAAAEALAADPAAAARRAEALRKRNEKRAAGLAVGGQRRASNALPGPACPLRTKNPFAKAALLARYTYGLPSFGAHRWAGKTIYLPRGIVPPGMLGPPAREAELYGSELRLRSGKRLEPRPVAEWTLRALQGAFLDDPHGPLHAVAVAKRAVSPPQTLVLSCNLPGGGEVDTRFIQEVLRAQGALCHGLKPLPPGLPGREVRKHDAVMGRGTFTRLVLGGELAAAHLPDLFWDAEGAAIKRVAAVVACGSVAMPFASKGKPHDNAELDQALLDAADEAAKAALETGSLDVMRAKLAELEREGWLAQAEEKPEPKPKKKKTKKKKKGGHGCGTEEQEGVRGDRVTTGCQRLSATVPTPVVINKQFGPDTNANRRLHLFNWYLAGLLEYLIAAFSIVNLRAACQMAQISLRLLEQQPYNYGFWAMQWMNGPDKITDPHRDVNDAREGYAALIYFHPDGDRDRRLHRLRFPALGISVELRHGDVVFIKGHYLKHGVVEDDDTEGRYCIVLTLGNNLKVNSEGASPNAP
eukprot:tig00020801_g13930.t1